MGVVVARNVKYEIDDTAYWHVAARNSLVFHNARLGEGIFWGASATAQLPGLQNVISPYAAYHADREKEAVFEGVRACEFPGRPSRMKAFFLFDSLTRAEEAQRSWFGQEDRIVVETRIVAGSNRHRADARLLDAHKADWEANARRYWSGEVTADPRPEVIVHGLLYFPEWEKFSLLKP